MMTDVDRSEAAFLGMALISMFAWLLAGMPLAGAIVGVVVLVSIPIIDWLAEKNAKRTFRRWVRDAHPHWSEFEVRAAVDEVERRIEEERRGKQ